MPTAASSIVGVIGMSCGESARYSANYASLMNVVRPPGTIFASVIGLSIANNWNLIAQSFLQSEAEWLFLVNDDHVYSPDILSKLLAHNVDIVTGLYLGRSFPHMPIIYDEVDNIGRTFPRYLADGEKGLIPIKACGDGCLLIRRKVLETIPYPWWDLGQLSIVSCDHDLSFSKKVREAGFQIYCDFGATVGHIACMTVMPQQNENGQWGTFLLQGTNVIAIPSPQTV